METEKGFPNSTVTAIFQDSRGFLWIGGYAGLYRYDGYEVVPYFYDPHDSLTIGDNKITKIIEDRQGNIWIGTQNGLNCFDRKTETFRRFFFTPGSLQGLSRFSILDLLEDEAGRIWVSTFLDAVIFDPQDETVERLDFAGERLYFHKFQLGHDSMVWLITTQGLWKTDQYGGAPKPVSVPGWGSLFTRIISIEEDVSGMLWLGTDNGLVSYLPGEAAMEHIPLGKASKLSVFSVLAARDGWIWCGTLQGVFRYHPPTKALQHLQYDPDDGYSLRNNHVETLFEDSIGNVWLGTIAGVNLFRPATGIFLRYPNSYQSKVSSVATFRSFLEVVPGRLLLWEQEEGLVVFDWQKGIREPFLNQLTQQLKAWETGVYVFFRDDRGRIWMGTGRGVFVFDPSTGFLNHYYRDSGDSMALSDDMIRDIAQDSTGAIWLATWDRGLNRILEDQGRVKDYFSAIDGTYRDAARRIFVDRSGSVWAGTRGGLLKYAPEKDAFITYRRDPDNPNSMSENTAFDIYEDESGHLWVGTYGGGLNEFDPATETFTHYTFKDGLPDQTVFSILPDDHGKLWLSTYKGIVQFDPRGKTFKGFDYRDGLLNKQYDAFSYYRIPSTGELVYEGKQGIDIFHPDSIQPDPVPPPVRFTDFLIANQPVPIRGQATTGVDGFFLDQSITETNELAVPYRHNTLTFKFAAPHLSNPEKIRYSYRLEGFDQEWQDLGNRRTVTFTQLAPGRYRLIVRAVNADGIRNEEDASLALIITPPWWRTWWAYLLYLLLFLAGIYAYLRYQRRRLRLQADLAFQQREAERLQELDTVKNQLYTNITHEFRTPLTVILGLTDEIPVYHQKEETGRLVQAVGLVRRNSRKLLQLISQMLDLAKVEAGKITLHLQQGDVVAYLKYLAESFESLAESKNIDLTFTAEPATLIMDYDEEKLQYIFSNFVSNALKFTPEGGAVAIRTGAVEEAPERFLRLEVSDTGIGIPADKLPHIFERFYQVDAGSSRPGEGTGIGLTLAKELVELHEGKIEVESAVGRGTSFTVLMPIRNNAPFREESSFSSGRPEPSPAGPVDPGLLSSSQSLRPEEDLPTVLLVEDSPDIIIYLESCLRGRYEILTAVNGRLGLEKAFEVVPDIIISDVMMPEVDGFELTEKLKTDERTSHIPIILLTAKATAADRLAGLKRGADAYLSKPFHKEELLIRLEKLIELRQKLQERYGALSPPPATDDPALQLEDEFVRKVRQLVEENLGDPSFGVHELAAAVFLSRTQVHRKLKALTGQSTGHFIRTMRLQRAMELLKAGPESVQAVAYEVGFTDPAYFSRVFAEEFGGPPSGFIEE